VVPHATVVVSEREYRAKLAGIYPYANVLTAAGITRVRPVAYECGPLDEFERTQDLLV
jgi:hypothetical protein